MYHMSSEFFWIIEMSLNYHCLLLVKHLESNTICFMTEGCFDEGTKDKSHFLLLFLDLVLLKKTFALLGTKSVHIFLTFLMFIFSWTCSVVCLVVFLHTSRQRLVIFHKI